MDTPPRYSTDPLPDYRHLPGSTPHPTRDPAGHSYGRPEPILPDMNSIDWRQCGEYLYGIDLFNQEYWWECHEVLEGLWHAAGHDSAAGEVLQAVIQCAAAHLKVRSARLAGAGRLFEHSLVHVGRRGALTLGLDLEALVRDTRAYLVHTGARPAQLRLDFTRP